MEGTLAAAPRYNLKRVFQLRDKLADDTLSDFCGFTPIGESFEELVDTICAAIPRAKRRAVWDSIRDVAGTLLTTDDVWRMSWRLAGNIGLLRNGVAVPPWHVQQEVEWMPAQIQAFSEGTSHRGKAGGYFQMRILAGTACPLRLTKFWTKGFCKLISAKLGYTTRRGDFPLGHISELVSLRLWVYIEPKYCGPNGPDFREIGSTGALWQWNRRIVRMRFRHNWRCPYSFDHHCFLCPVGYKECPAATHADTHNT